MVAAYYEVIDALTPEQALLASALLRFLLERPVHLSKQMVCRRRKAAVTVIQRAAALEASPWPTGTS
jgi:hypothetical protein